MRDLMSGVAAVAPSDVPHDVREGDVQQVTPTPLPKMECARSLTRMPPPFCAASKPTST
jgi:hypothetical protein